MFRLKPTALPTNQSEEKLADDFNLFFINKILDIRTNFSSSAPASIEDRDLPCGFSDFIEPTDSNIIDIIQSISSKTCNLDPIPTSELKQHLQQLVPAIAAIVRTSLKDGKFPTSLKTTVVRPKLKKPDLDTELFQSYRPVANITFIAKVIEKSVAIQTYDYLNENALLPSFQSAHRPQHSTETALVRVTNDILKALDSRTDIILVMLDLSATFDTIDHDILLKRLHSYFGFKDTVLTWFKSYLLGRTQFVCIGKSSSTPRDLQFGVPQGSILGPLLFTLYIAPLQDLIKSYNLDCMFYADDTQLYIAVNPSTLVVSMDILSSCIKAIFDWNTVNKLQTNRGKTDVLCLSSCFVKQPSAPNQLYVANVPVNIKPMVRNLGVYMDTNFTLADHIKGISKKAFFFINAIGRIRKYLSMDSLKRLVNALVLSHLDYCNSLLFGLPFSELSKLQRIQNTAARLITGAKKRDHITPVLHDLHWLPIHARLEFKILLLTYKCLNNQAPSYLSDLIKPYKPTRKLRSSTKSLLQSNFRPNTQYYGERSFSFSAPKLWNILPEHNKTSPSVDSIKYSILSI